MAHVPYASVVVRLMYAMVWNRPVITHAMGVLSRYMSTPVKENFTTVNRVFRYLCGKKDYSIFYQRKPGGGSELNVHVFFDAEWVGDVDRWRSTNGYVFKMFDGESTR
jgi:hypothetical protein